MTSTLDTSALLLRVGPDMDRIEMLYSTSRVGRPVVKELAIAVGYTFDEATG